MQKKILILNNSFFNSGAEHSINTFIQHCPDKYSFIYAISKSAQIPSTLNRDVHIYQIPFIWLVYTVNPFRIFCYIINIIICTIKLYKISGNHKIDLIYVNTVKAVCYGLSLKLFTRCKILWHIRDNLDKSVLWKICSFYCDKMITVSDAIDNIQFIPDTKIRRIYTGIDTVYWSPVQMKKRATHNRKIQIAHVGQLTRWKNHSDFIRMAHIICRRFENVQFIIVGDDLSGREKKYKAELAALVEQLELNSKLIFAGYRKDIKDALNDIDILVHTAINEPFGRVLIEAMALQKPVLAYNCGGPKEIIVDNGNGYLIEPGNIEELAEKTSCLIENEKLRSEFGKAGRQRVIEKFNIDRYIQQMEEVFDAM